MAILLSKQAIVYLFESCQQESAVRCESFPEQLTDLDLNRLFSVIESADQSVFGVKTNDSLIKQITHIVFHLNKQHVLSDGNKRFSLLVVLYLCEEHYLQHNKMSASDWEMFIMRVASDSHFTKEQATEYLAEKLQPE